MSCTHIFLVSIRDSKISSEVEMNENSWIFDIVKDTAKLRLMLEALLIDDLKRRDSTFDLNQLLNGSSTEHTDDTFLPKADRSTQETTEGDEEFDLTPEQMDFFGDGI